jgi:hypothetical protein
MLCRQLSIEMHEISSRCPLYDPLSLSPCVIQDEGAAGQGVVVDGGVHAGGEEDGGEESKSSKSSTPPIPTPSGEEEAHAHAAASQGGGGGGGAGRGRLPLTVPREVDLRVEQLFNKALSLICKRRYGSNGCNGTGGTGGTGQLSKPASGEAADVSLGSELEKALNGYKLSDLEKRLLQWHIANLEYGCGAPLAQVSLKPWDPDHACKPKPQTLNPKP